MAILYSSEIVGKPKLRYRMVTKWLKQVVLDLGYSVGDLTYIFCSDEYLKEINLKYLKHDYYTDIVTFDYGEGNYISGDIQLSEHNDYRLLDKSELLNLDWAEADLPIVEEFLKLGL